MNRSKKVSQAKRRQRQTMLMIVELKERKEDRQKRMEKNFHLFKNSFKFFCEHTYTITLLSPNFRF